MAKSRASMTPEEKAHADARVRAWCAANPERRKKIARDWARDWRDANRAEVNEQARLARPKQMERARVRYQCDDDYRTRILLRSKLYQAVHRLPSKTRELSRWGARSTIGPLVGCSPIGLMNHLQEQFEPGMSWGNHGEGGWEIDHIKPCASFDLTDPDQRRACSAREPASALADSEDQAARRIPTNSRLFGYFLSCRFCLQADRGDQSPHHRDARADGSAIAASLAVRRCLRAAQGRDRL